jgi:phosphatidylglycerol lysyltransferase
LEKVLTLPARVAAREGGFSSAERIGYLKAYGSHSQSFSTMQPGMAYFDLPGVGYIAFMNRWGVKIALADPVCDPVHFELIIDRFLKHHPSGQFVQASGPVADILHRKYGYYTTQFGSEIRIDLQAWDLKGGKKQVIRTAVNQAKSMGVEIKESHKDDDACVISQNWIKTRACSRQEIRFLIRPLKSDYRENSRHFYAYVDGKAVGFIFFDPIYEGNRVVSYVPNISRSCPSFKQGLWYVIMKHAMDVFKAEGLPFLDLGLVPLMLADDMEPCESKPLRKIMALIYEHGNALFNFKGLQFAKERFQGKVEKNYCCHKRSLPLWSLVALMKMTGVV